MGRFGLVGNDTDNDTDVDTPVNVDIVGGASPITTTTTTTPRRRKSSRFGLSAIQQHYEEEEEELENRSPLKGGGVLLSRSPASAFVLKKQLTSPHTPIHHSPLSTPATTRKRLSTSTKSTPNAKSPSLDYSPSQRNHPNRSVSVSPIKDQEERIVLKAVKSRIKHHQDQSSHISEAQIEQQSWEAANQKAIEVRKFQESLRQELDIQRKRESNSGGVSFGAKEIYEPPSEPSILSKLGGKDVLQEIADQFKSLEIAKSQKQAQRHSTLKSKNSKMHESVAKTISAQKAAEEAAAAAAAAAAQKKEEELKRIQREQQEKLEAEKKRLEEAARLEKEKEEQERERQRQQETMEKQKLQAAQDETKRKELEAKASAEKQAQAAIASELGGYVSAEAQKEADVYLARVRNYKQSTKTNIRNQKDLFNWCFMQKMGIRTRIGQVANVKSVFMEKATFVNGVFTEAKSKGELAYDWILNLTAKLIVNQAQSEASVNRAIAFALAHLSLILMNAHPDFLPVLMGRLCHKCIFIVPKYVKKTATMTNEEYFQQMGFKKSDGEMETETKFGERMSGMIALFAAIVQAREAQWPLPPALQPLLWQWPARMLNLPPRRISPQLLHTYFEIAGYIFSQTFPKQSQKMFQYLLDQYLPRVPKESVSTMTRLKLFFETGWKTKGFVEELEHRRFKDTVDLPVADGGDSQSQGSGGGGYHGGGGGYRGGGGGGYNRGGRW